MPNMHSQLVTGQLPPPTTSRTGEKRWWGDKQSQEGQRAKSRPTPVKQNWLPPPTTSRTGEKRCWGDKQSQEGQRAKSRPTPVTQNWGDIKEEYNSLCTNTYLATGAPFQPNVNDRIKKVSYSLYYTVFWEDFNLGFGHPNTDKCSTCERYKTNIRNADLPADEKTNLTVEFVIHRQKARKFYNELNVVADDTFTMCLDMMENQFETRTKEINLTSEGYAQTTLNLLNSQTPEKRVDIAVLQLQERHPSRTLFSNVDRPNNLEEELGITGMDEEIPSEEEIPWPDAIHELK
ncbi:hypothetical protein ElyMa_001857700 [Elysia marginata]|uniref:Uncharacterized protein n=1 Tax=Elysia marginata TaxID=1093978 RepID=A0AAV4EM82_9GAST|nr:hypothetical protein ElyMa_001857700 [Elysia marginata]